MVDHKVKIHRWLFGDLISLEMLQKHLVLKASFLIGLTFDTRAGKHIFRWYYPELQYLGKA